MTNPPDWPERMANAATVTGHTVGCLCAKCNSLRERPFPPGFSSDILVDRNECNGHVVTGGAMVHHLACPVHGDDVEGIIEIEPYGIRAIEDRGYDRAVAQLLDGERWELWVAAQPYDPDLANDEPSRSQIAEYLRAQREAE